MVTTRSKRKLSGKDIGDVKIPEKKRTKRKTDVEAAEKPPPKKNSKGKTINQIVYPYRNPPKQWGPKSLGKQLQMSRTRRRKEILQQNMSVGEFELLQNYSKEQVKYF